jgi:sec-independent protein translocase protein TatC
MALMDFFNRRKKDANTEMSFIDHLEELRWHIIRAVIAVLVGAILVFIYSDLVVNKVLFAPTRSDFVSARWLCSLGHKIGMGNTLCFPEVNAKFLENTMTGQFIASFTLAFIGGFIIAFPYICKTCTLTKGVKKNKRSYFLGISFVFYGSGFRLFYSYPLYGQFLF